MVDKIEVAKIVDHEDNYMQPWVAEAYKELDRQSLNGTSVKRSSSSGLDSESGVFSIPPIGKSELSVKENDKVVESSQKEGVTPKQLEAMAISASRQISTDLLAGAAAGKLSEAQITSITQGLDMLQYGAGSGRVSEVINGVNQRLKDQGSPMQISCPSKGKFDDSLPISLMDRITGRVVQTFVYRPSPIMFK